VIERPDGGVAEALVVSPDLIAEKPAADQVHAFGVERLWRIARRARPSDPHPVGLLHDRLERGDQPAGTRPPFDLAVRALRLVHRQPARGSPGVVMPGGPPPGAGLRRRYRLRLLIRPQNQLTAPASAIVPGCRPRSYRAPVGEARKADAVQATSRPAAPSLYGGLPAAGGGRGPRSRRVRRTTERAP